MLRDISFNSTLVQLKVNGTLTISQESFGFNSTLVQLKGTFKRT